MESESAVYSSNAVETAEAPRILVAEDQADVSEALCLLLKNHGYAAQFVNNPADAIAALKSSRFDGVLMDLNYTGGTTSGSEGLELLTQVQAIDSTLAVVVMTAWGSIELAVDALHRGACDFVQKPWDNAQLLKVLGEQLKRSQTLRAARRQEQFEKQEAAEIQRAMMAAENGNLTGFQMAVSFQPARGVAGDYYDVIALDDSRAGLCVADVAGKGIGAALLVSNLQAVVRTLAPQLFQPRELCSRVNQGVCANKIGGKFVAFFYGILNSAKNQLTYTNAGHNSPILVRAGGHHQRLNSEDTVLGTFAGWNYHEHHVELGSGDRLILFTDGITESTNANGAEFTEEALVETACANVRLAAAELKDAIMRSVLSHCDRVFSDDATLIVIAVE